MVLATSLCDENIQFLKLMILKVKKSHIGGNIQSFQNLINLKIVTIKCMSDNIVKWPPIQFEPSGDFHRIEI